MEKKGDAILHFLTHNARVLTDTQVARTWFSVNASPLKAAREALRSLQERGLISRRQAVLHPELELHAPIVAWIPGDALPDFGRAAWKLRSRWKKSPLPTHYAFATRKATYYTGGTMGGRKERRSEILHDICVTSLFLLFIQRWPERAKEWQHEDTLLRQGYFQAGDKIPDAFVGEVAIDFGGSYKRDKLAAFHAAMEAQGRAYEIW